VEVQVSRQNNGFNVYRFGTEANLIWPRIIAPFKFQSASGFVPKLKQRWVTIQNRTNSIPYKPLRVPLAIYGKRTQKNTCSMSPKLLC
jgi:hypothetical protein